MPKISIFVEPRSLVPFYSGLERYDQFVQDLKDEGNEVSVQEDVLKIPKGYILLSRSDYGNNTFHYLTSEVLSRIFLMDISRQIVSVELEKHKLAGAIDSLHLSEYNAGCECGQLFGLSSINVGKKVPLPWYESEHYCMIKSKKKLPRLLTDYLLELDKYYHETQKNLA